MEVARPRPVSGLPPLNSHVATEIEGGAQMICRLPKLFPSQVGRIAFLSVCALVLVVLVPATLRAQRSRSFGDSDGGENKPAFSDFKGVRIGMSADEARKKLGNPKEKSAEQDFYLFNDTQAVQVFYDKAGAVSAISIDFMGGSSSVPSAKEVLGSDAETKADGSVYKLIRYPKAGYWVSYSRTAGDSPTVTITMQKIEH